MRITWNARPIVTFTLVGALFLTGCGKSTAGDSQSASAKQTVDAALTAVRTPTFAGTTPTTTVTIIPMASTATAQTDTGPGAVATTAQPMAPTMNFTATLAAVRTADAYHCAATQVAASSLTPTPTLTPAATPSFGALKPLRFATVFLNQSPPWIAGRTELGVEWFGAATGIDTLYVGPPEAGDYTTLAVIINRLVAEGLNGLCVLPMPGAEALDPALQKARDAGAVVVMIENQGATKFNYNLIPFALDEFGIHLVDRLSGGMGNEGSYLLVTDSGDAFSAEITAAALKRQEHTYDKLLSIVMDVSARPEQIYGDTTEAISQYPAIKGILVTTPHALTAVGNAVENAGYAASTFVVGVALPSEASGGLRSGAVDVVSQLDPAIGAAACNEIVRRALLGIETQHGANLGLPGYENLVIQDWIGWHRPLIAQAWLDVAAGTEGQHPY